MCIYAHKYTHLNIDPEEVEIFCDVLFEVPRMAEDKVEKKRCAWSRVAVAALVTSAGFLYGFNHCELLFPCSHQLNSCCRGDGIGTERNTPVSSGSLGAVLPPLQT